MSNKGDMSIYRFIGKPDSVFPYLKTGKLYDLVIEEKRKRFSSEKFPIITAPIRCPYSSWNTFHQNWKKA